MQVKHVESQALHSVPFMKVLSGQLSIQLPLTKNLLAEQLEQVVGELQEAQLERHPLQMPLLSWRPTGQVVHPEASPLVQVSQLISHLEHPPSSPLKNPFEHVPHWFLPVQLGQLLGQGTQALNPVELSG